MALEQIIIDFGQDDRGFWYWKSGEVEGGPYRTAEDAERAATSVLLGPGCKVINAHREAINETKH